MHQSAIELTCFLSIDFFRFLGSKFAIVKRYRNQKFLFYVLLWNCTHYRDNVRKRQTPNAS